MRTSRRRHADNRGSKLRRAAGAAHAVGGVGAARDGDRLRRQRVRRRRRAAEGRPRRRRSGTPRAPTAGGRLFLARYDVDGTLDPLFGENGRIFGEFPNFPRATAMAIDSRGRIIVAGVTNDRRPASSPSMRFTRSGFLDTSFGNGGLATLNAGSGEVVNDVAVDSSGRVIVAGQVQVVAGRRRRARDSWSRGSTCSAGPTRLRRARTGRGDGVVAFPVGIGDSGATSVVLDGDSRILVGGFGTEQSSGEPPSAASPSRGSSTPASSTTTSATTTASSRSTSACPASSRTSPSPTTARSSPPATRSPRSTPPASRSSSRASTAAARSTRLRRRRRVHPLRLRRGALAARPRDRRRQARTASSSPARSPTAASPPATSTTTRSCSPATSPTARPTPRSRPAAR